MKKAWLFCLIMTLYGLVPASINSLWLLRSENSIVIFRQVCGCPCPDARVIGGHLPIPKDISAEYPGIHTRQITISGNSPFEPFNLETGLSEILIMGEVVGVDTIFCSRNDCEIAPRFEVNNWTFNEYKPRFLIWSKEFTIGYILGIPLIILGLIFIELIKYIKR